MYHVTKEQIKEKYSGNYAIFICKDQTGYFDWIRDQDEVRKTFEELILMDESKVLAWYEGLSLQGGITILREEFYRQKKRIMNGRQRGLDFNSLDQLVMKNTGGR